MTVGQRIKEARQNRNLTLEELAKKIGVAAQTIYKYENGIIIDIPTTRIKQIASALNISPAYLVGWEDTTTISSLENDYYGHLNNGSERDDILRVLFHIGYKATPNIFSFNAKDGIKTWTITDIQTQKKYIVPADELEKLDEQIMSFSKNQIEELLNTWKE